MDYNTVRLYFKHSFFCFEKTIKKILSSGFEFFESLRKTIGNELPLIVEDLGEVTNEVFKLRDHFQFYGIRILQMGFSTYADNIYSPHHYIPNSIAYTGSFLSFSFHFQFQLKFVCRNT